MLTCRRQIFEIFGQQWGSVDVGFRAWQILAPEPEHLGRVNDAPGVVLQIASIFELVLGKVIRVAGDWNVQHLADYARDLFIASLLGNNSRLECVNSPRGKAVYLIHSQCCLQHYHH